MLGHQAQLVIGVRPQPPCGPATVAMMPTVGDDAHGRVWETPEQSGWCVRMEPNSTTRRMRRDSSPQRGTPALPTPSTATQQRPQLAGINAAASRLAAHQTGSEAWERDQMLDRLQNLRRVLPALAQEMAAARRQAARLRIDNRRLSEQVRQLRKTMAAHEHKPA